VGYLVGEAKLAMLTAEPTGDVTVRSAADGRVVATVPAGPANADADSGDTIRIVDFSAVSQPGRYYLEAPGIGNSFEFDVSDDAFARAFRLSMLCFTGLRCGTEVNLGPEFAGYQHAPCHTADALFDPSSGRAGSKPLSGGWHDAGDYGRYVVNSGITTGTLLWAYELNADKLRQVVLGIPESGGPLPDVLAEIRWNLDWMLKMQDEDGGAWHKATTARFPAFIMPEDDREPVLIIGNAKAPYKTTEGTADLVAVAAIAARTYRPFDSAYADRCLRAAELGWKWLEATPDNHFGGNPKGIATGAYGDGNAKDERLWAAAELFSTTGKAEYNEYFKANYGTGRRIIDPASPQSWSNVRHLAMYAYVLTRQPTADAQAQEAIRREALAAADAIAERSNANGYRIPLARRDYVWGSNGVVANYAMMLRIANHVSPKPEYVNAAQDCVHYLLGRNVFNTSYVSHVGSRWAKNPHHRPSGADKMDEPWPGMLMGGPNASGNSPAARQWQDVEGSFTTNEIAINWNAALAFALAEALP
jgi:endoglucanase